MSERTQGLLLLALFLLGAYVLSRVAGASASGILMFVTMAGMNAYLGRERRANRRALAQLIEALRSHDSETRDQFLSGLTSPQLVTYLREVLTADGSEERVGDVERFPFPDSLRRRTAQLYWLSWTVSIVALLLAAFGGGSFGLQLFLLAVAALGGVGAFRFMRQERRYRSVIELTPFRITEVSSDGARRTLLLNRYLELHNEPRRNRMRLTPGGHDFDISLDYRLMAFTRLLEQLTSYAGFTRNEPG